MPIKIDKRYLESFFDCVLNEELVDMAVRRMVLVFEGDDGDYAIASSLNDEAATIKVLERSIKLLGDDDETV